MFARGCIPKKVFIDYQTDRLKTIKKEVLKFKSKSAVKEMENELSGKKVKKDPNEYYESGSSTVWTKGWR